MLSQGSKCSSHAEAIGSDQSLSCLLISTGRRQLQNTIACQLCKSSDGELSERCFRSVPLITRLRHSASAEHVIVLFWKFLRSEKALRLSSFHPTRQHGKLAKRKKSVCVRIYQFLMETRKYFPFLCCDVVPHFPLVSHYSPFLKFPRQEEHKFPPRPCSVRSGRRKLFPFSSDFCCSDFYEVT